MDPHLVIAIFHAIIIAPFFLYIGLAREQVPDSVLSALVPLGLGIGAYHAYKAYAKISLGANPWVNSIHVLLVAPLLIVIGLYGKTTSRRYFEMLLMLGFAALGYHTLSIIRAIMSL